MWRLCISIIVWKIIFRNRRFHPSAVVTFVLFAKGDGIVFHMAGNHDVFAIVDMIINGAPCSDTDSNVKSGWASISSLGTLVYRECGPWKISSKPRTSLTVGSEIWCL